MMTEAKSILKELHIAKVSAELTADYVFNSFPETLWRANMLLFELSASLEECVSEGKGMSLLHKLYLFLSFIVSRL